jgi:hypothetical protein
MQTAITMQPGPPAPPGPFPQLIYTLEWWDHVAWWMCSYDRAQARGEGRAKARVLIFLVGIPLVMGAVLLMLAATPGVEKVGLRGVLIVGLGMAAILVVAGYLGTRRGFPGDVLAKAARDDHEGKMKDKALQLADTGEVINCHRVHWFEATAEGFTEITELDRVSPQGVGHYEYHESGGPWSLIQEIVAAEKHIFLIGRDEVVWIIPRRCFADDAAADRFVEVIGACRAAVARPSMDIMALPPAAI